MRKLLGSNVSGFVCSKKHFMESSLLKGCEGGGDNRDLTCFACHLHAENIGNLISEAVHLRPADASKQVSSEFVTEI